MTLQDHKDYLTWLKKGYGKGEFGMAVPKREGAFYFGHYIAYDEYVDKYEAEVIKQESGQ